MESSSLGGRFDRVVILTGAGISAESGVSTFRDKQGIWSKVDFRQVATPEGFAADPEKVLAFYSMRREAHSGVTPNAAHHALARLEREHRGEVLIVTQNVDELHELAGSKNLIHMHGEVFRTLCHACRHSHADRTPFSVGHVCGACGTAGTLRPDVVWFGETPYHLDVILAAMDSATAFVSIGTSGSVAPASHFVRHARNRGIYALELNLEPSEGADLFTDTRHGKASDLVPAFVEDVLRAS